MKQRFPWCGELEIAPRVLKSSLDIPHAEPLHNITIGFRVFFGAFQGGG